ncbi:MAG: FAD-dependent oxidoreductase [Candidatus Heimdallarchaeota archaeon]|nr:FAD-dependent oxidoreductase [Candidatus Heimdallarchaeota archaeon]
MAKKVVIVGGVAGGASTAARLRRLEEFTEIIILDRGPYVSFANCGLPYYVGQVIKEKDTLELVKPVDFKTKFNIDVRVNNEVLSIDRKKKQVMVKNLETNEEYALEYDNLVLSPGAECLRPNFEGIDEVPVFTLRNIPDTLKIEDFIKTNNPTTATVIGGGYVGLEMAENLSHRGIRVSLIELLTQVMPTLDKDMAQFINNEIVLNRIQLILGDGVKSFAKNNSGSNKYVVTTQSGKKVVTDLVILCIGVRPQTELAKAADLNLTERGYIIVNDQMQTSDTDIYAVGDAIQIQNFITHKDTVVPLAGPANRQGRIAADNIAGRESKYKGAIGTAVLQIFSQTAAQTGLTERQLQGLDIDYEKIYIHPKNHAGYYPDAQPIAMKLIFAKKDGKILGAQAVGGPGTEKRIDVVATAIYFGGTVYDLQDLELCYAPPFGCARDCVNMAGFVASNVQSGEVDLCHWNEVEKIKSDGGLIVDVRAPDLYEAEHIEGSINVPLGQLRSRLDELSKDKTIFVYCQVGFSSYLAYRILQHNGYKVKNLTGGFNTYQISNLPPGGHVGELKPYNTQGC